MSLTGQRQEIAAILSTVEGVSGYKFRPTGLKTGAAWPLLGSLTRGPVTDFEVTWRIQVVLPDDEQQASEWFDLNYEPIAEALQDFGYVESIEPGALHPSEGDALVMELTVRKEA